MTVNLPHQLTLFVCSVLSSLQALVALLKDAPPAVAGHAIEALKYMLRAPEASDSFEALSGPPLYLADRLGFNGRLRLAVVKNKAVMEPLLLFCITNASQNPSTDMEWVVIAATNLLGRLWFDGLERRELWCSIGPGRHGER